MKTFRALSVVAPAGDRIRSGEKHLEIRRWQPEALPLRDLVIVQNRHRLNSTDFPEDPEGLAVALVDVVAVRPWAEADLAASGAARWEPGWLAWELANVRPLEARARVPARLRIYEVAL